MKTLIKIALGFLLLVSAAAATGSSNSVVSDIYPEAIGNSITGDSNLAQVTNAASFVLGDNNDIDQTMYFTANGNCLTADLGQTNFCQFGGMTANATGCENDLEDWRVHILCQKNY